MCLGECGPRSSVQSGHTNPSQVNKIKHSGLEGLVDESSLLTLGVSLACLTAGLARNITSRESMTLYSSVNPIPQVGSDPYRLSAD